MASFKRGSAGPLVEGSITSLASRRAHAERVAVYLDGSRTFDLAVVVVEVAGLRVGDRLSVGDQERLLEQDAPYRARERAVHLLAVRDRSCHEVRLRLQQAGFSPAVVEGTVAWLVGLDYLDDARFAARYSVEKARSGWGPRRIGAELARKGVERKLVGEVLSGEGSEPAGGAEGIAALTTLARRRFGAQLDRDPQGGSRRLAGFLGRRGYDWDTIHAVLRELEAETPEVENGPLP